MQKTTTTAVSSTTLRKLWESMIPIGEDQHPQALETLGLSFRERINPILVNDLRLTRNGGVGFAAKANQVVTAVEITVDPGNVDTYISSSEGLWRSAKREKDHQLVICSNALEAVSYSCTAMNHFMRLIACGPQPSAEIDALIEAEIRELPYGMVTVATRPTEFERMSDIFARVGRTKLSLHNDVPPEPYRTWNEYARDGVSIPEGFEHLIQ